MRLLIIAFAIIFSSCDAQQQNGTMNDGGNKQTVYQFTVPTIEGGELKLSDLKGKKILVVNTASKCGYTPQYEGLETLSKEYKDKLVVIGFPANNFGGQEPGTEEEISEFCKMRYGVTFPLTKKVDVVGENIHPLFSWLTHKDKNGVLDAEIKWNFNKFLIDENGKLLAYFPSKVKPLDAEITDYLK